MEDTVLEAPAQEPSIASLRSMLRKEPAAQAAQPETPEPAAPVVEQPKEAAPEPAQATQQAEVEDYELPENVKKKIASEAKKQAFFQSKIDQANSARKAAQNEFESFKGKPGSEPAPTTEPKKDARPTRPDLATFPGSLAEYNSAFAEYEAKFEDWIGNQSRESVRKELTEQQGREAAKSAWDAATVKHGEEFPALMETLRTSIPVELQTAISAQGDWSGIAVHLAKNPAERESLVAKFKEAPFAAIAQLGKLEAQLTSTAQTEQTEKPPLPKPLKPIAGGPSGALKPVDLEKAPMSDFKREVKRMLKHG